MEKWEYRTEFVYANIDQEGVKEFFLKKYPNWKNPSKYTPETMELYLNQLGDEGWELVHMEPVQAVGKNGDVGVQGGSTIWLWSNVYFCALKRRL